MPRIVDKGFEELLNENRGLASQYVPEWRPPDDEDPGVALLKIFAHMQEEIISRLNRVPEKSFGAFLEMLGMKLRPALPSRAPITFYLAEGLKEKVFVPAGTQIAAPRTGKHDALTFETAENFTASRAYIDEVFSVDPDNDAIYCHTAQLRDGKEFRLFRSSNIQKHALYLGHADLFRVNESSQINLLIKFSSEIDPEFLRSLRWKYWNGNEEKKIIPSISKQSEENLYRIILVPGEEIKEKEIGSKSCIWIECILESVIGWANLPTIKEIKIESVSLPGDIFIKPDRCLYNDQILDLTKKIYPLGRQPKIYDAFYITSKEAFSKRGGRVTITFKRDIKGEAKVVPTNDIELSWEYWNGAVWKALELEEDSNLGNILKGFLIFTCPKDLQETAIGGVKGLWIRVRLMNGNYGSFIIAPTDTENILTVQPVFYPPYLGKIEISYESDACALLQHCISYNNLEYKDVSEASRGLGFKPFLPINDSMETLYLGFKDPWSGETMSIFFSLLDEGTPDVRRPKIKWSYWSQAQNLEEVGDGKGEMDKPISKLVLVDGEGLAAGREIMLRQLFGQDESTELASISYIEGRTVYLDRVLGQSFTRAANVFRRLYLDAQDSTDDMTRAGILKCVTPYKHQKTPKFGRDSYWIIGSFNCDHHREPNAAMIRGVYPNTVWAEQVETIRDEILGSSEGEKGNTYRCNKRPVISPELWVRDGTVMPEEDKELLLSEGFELQEILDKTGKAVDTWIRWKAVDDFCGSSQKSRHYVLDEAAGEISFGDGIRGMIPPAGKNNIKISYKSGGGIQGNVAAGEISAPKTPVAGVGRVMNHVAAEGGSDVETMEELFSRGPRSVRSLERAVSREDFEALAKASSSYVARAKSFVDGPRLKVIVIPKGEEDKPAPSSILKKDVGDYIIKRSMSTVASYNLDIIEPTYKEIMVKAELILESVDLAGPLEKEVRDRLRRFFHPLTGGFDGAGWEFGRDVHISDVYAMLEGVKGVDHLEDLKLNDKPDDVAVKDHEMVCSGEHEIRLSFRSA